MFQSFLNWISSRVSYFGRGGWGGDKEFLLSEPQLGAKFLPLLTLGVHVHEGYGTLCVSTVYKLLTRFMLEIKHQQALR